MNTNNELLEYIESSADMGVKSLTTLINLIHEKDNKITKEVEEALKGYENILKKSKKLLEKRKIKPKTKGIMAEVGSKMSMNMELMKDNSDSRIADMIIKGFTMGIVDIEKKIEKYKNNVDDNIINLAKEYKKFQEQGIKNIKPYL